MTDHPPRAAMSKRDRMRRRALIVRRARALGLDRDHLDAPVVPVDEDDQGGDDDHEA